MTELSAYNPILENIKQQAREGWPGEIGQERAVKLDIFIRKFTSEYSEAFNLTADQVLETIEKSRKSTAINFYQAANFPALRDVNVFNTQMEFMNSIPSKKFRCPRCKGISENPYVCNSGKDITKGIKCDWQAHGLFGCLDQGFKFTIKESFLEKPYVETCFLPIEYEKTEEKNSEW